MERKNLKLSMSSILIKDGLIITMNPQQEVINGDIYIEEGRIAEIGKIEQEGEEIIDAEGKVIMPGFVQTHIHLCQTLFRGLGDDLELLEWLRQVIWPLEAAHDEETIYWSAMLSAAELIRGGTTCVQTMETVHHTESAFEAVAESGLRAVMGKAMMDEGEGLPVALRENTEESIEASVELLEKWHKREGRIRYAFAPRFVLSCSERLLCEVRDLAEEYRVGVHTHCSENPKETQLVREKRGFDNLIYFHHLGLTGERLRLAHCVWLTEEEMDIAGKTKVKILHCPTANLKLGSGIARVPEMMERGINVSLGADGAPCNNNLDMLREVRQAALIQRLNNSAIPAIELLRMATLGGAEALLWEDEIGSIERNKKADIIILDMNKVHSSPWWEGNLISNLVYASSSSDVETVIIDGRIVMRDRELLTIDEERVIAESRKAIRKLLKKANI